MNSPKSDPKPWMLRKFLIVRKEGSEDWVVMSEAGGRTMSRQLPPVVGRECIQACHAAVMEVLRRHGMTPFT